MVARHHALAGLSLAPWRRPGPCGRRATRCGRPAEAGPWAAAAGATHLARRRCGVARRRPAATGGGSWLDRRRHRTCRGRAGARGDLRRRPDRPLRRAQAAPRSTRPTRPAWCVELLPDVDRLAREVSTLTATTDIPAIGSPRSRAGRPTRARPGGCSVPDSTRSRPHEHCAGHLGPVGTGKSSLIATICRELAPTLRLAVVTNDIYTDEDARFLALPACSPRNASSGSRPAPPAHGHPRRRHREPDRRRGPRAAVRAARRVPSSPAATSSRPPFRPRWWTHRCSCSTWPVAVTWPARVARGSSARTCWCSTRQTWRRTSAWTSPGWSTTPSTPAPTVRCCRCHGPTPTLSPPWCRGWSGGSTSSSGGRWSLSTLARRLRMPTPMTLPPALEVRSSHLRASPSRRTAARGSRWSRSRRSVAGDHVEVTVRVARGAALEIVEPGGTVAYMMRGRRARGTSTWRSRKAGV